MFPIWQQTGIPEKNSAQSDIQDCNVKHITT